jgi:putative endonuclease
MSDHTDNNDECIYYVYILETSSKGSKRNKFYTGYTGDLYRRLEEHKTGKGAKFCRGKKVKLEYFETCFNRSDAMRRELEIKKLTHEEKAQLIEEFQQM